MPVPLQVVQTMVESPEQFTHVDVFTSPLPIVMDVVPFPSQKRHTETPVPSQMKHGCVLGLLSERKKKKRESEREKRRWKLKFSHREEKRREEKRREERERRRRKNDLGRLVT